MLNLRNLLVLGSRVLVNFTVGGIAPRVFTGSPKMRLLARQRCVEGYGISEIVGMERAANLLG